MLLEALKSVKVRYLLKYLEDSTESSSVKSSKLMTKGMKLSLLLLECIVRRRFIKICRGN